MMPLSPLVRGTSVPDDAGLEQADYNKRLGESQIYAAYGSARAAVRQSFAVVGETARFL
jgi:hypothetical protein